MFLTTHAVIATSLTSRFINPWLGFFVGLISHYILDAIPHGDESLIPKKITESKKQLLLFGYALADGLIMLGIIFFIMTKIQLNPTVLWSAVLGSILPDILWGLGRITNFKFLKFLSKPHDVIHNIGNIKIPMWLGIFLQIIILLIIIIYLI